jgi:hypothetical protein
MGRHRPTRLYRGLQGSFLAFLAALLVAGVIAPASAADPPGSFAAPGLRVTPPILHFGSIGPVEARQRTFTITNTGTDPVHFSSSSNQVPFDQAGFCPMLMPGESCTLTVIAKSRWVFSGFIFDIPPGTYESQVDLFVPLHERVISVPVTVKITD